MAATQSASWSQTAHNLYLPPIGHSELAGALTIPTANTRGTGLLPGLGTPYSGITAEPAPAPAAVGISITALPSSTSEIDVIALIPPAPARSVAISSVSRFCSVKGCRTLVPRDSYYKMCERCRNKYRNYGTTKRAKWKRTRNATSLDLDSLRELENKRRAEAGLSVSVFRQDICAQI
jgi:hypothetical protein